MTEERIAAPDTPRFNIGRVIAASAGLLIRNFFPFIVITLAVSLPSYLISYWYQTLPVDPAGGYLTWHGAAALLNIVVGFLAGALALGAITHGVLQKLRRQPVSIGACLQRGLAQTPPSS